MLLSLCHPGHRSSPSTIYMLQPACLKHSRPSCRLTYYSGLIASQPRQQYGPYVQRPSFDPSPLLGRTACCCECGVVLPTAYWTGCSHRCSSRTTTLPQERVMQCNNTMHASNYLPVGCGRSRKARYMTLVLSNGRARARYFAFVNKHLTIAKRHAKSLMESDNAVDGPLSTHMPRCGVAHVVTGQSNLYSCNFYKEEPRQPPFHLVG